MRCEWDENKRRGNLDKHGVDFLDAALLLQHDPLIFEDTRKNYGECRYIALGEMNGILLKVVFTPRGERFRIISARRATKAERRFYYENL